MNKALFTLLIIASSVSVTAQSKIPFFNNTGGKSGFFNYAVSHSLSKTDDKVRYQLEDIDYKMYAYEENGHWNPIFNEAGQNTILFERHYIGGAEGWIVTKTVYTYDSLGQVLEQEVFRSEEPIDTVWSANKKTQFYYSELGLLDSTYVFDFKDNNYELKERSRYYGDEFGADTLVLYDKYELTGFELDRKYEFVITPDSNLVTKNYYYNMAWAPGGVNWVLRSVTKTKTDINSNIITVINYDADSVLIPEYKSVHDLTMNGSISYSEYFEWQEDSLKWMKYAMMLNTFGSLDESELCDMGQINNEEYFFDLPYSKYDMCTKSEYYLLDSLNSWELFGDLKFTYNDLQTNITEHRTIQFAIFPNPTSDYIQLTWEGSNKANVTIYNAFGQVVKSETINKNSKVDVSDLQAGLYYVQLLDNGTEIGMQRLMITL